jgi:hypothetical protein
MKATHAKKEAGQTAACLLKASDQSWSVALGQQAQQCQEAITNAKQRQTAESQAG